MWVVISRIILKYRLIILFSVILSTVFMLFQANSVKLAYQMAKILPKTSPVFLDFENFKAKFGDNRNALVIGVENENLFHLSEYNAWIKLSEELKNIDGVENTVSINDLSLLVKDTINKKFESKKWSDLNYTGQEEFDSIVDNLISLPFYKNLFYNNKSKATLLIVSIDKEILKTPDREILIQQIHQKGEQYAKKHNLELHYSGLPYIRTVDNIQVRKEISLFILLTLLITSFILYLFFRSVKVTLISMFVVIDGVIWTFGTISFFGFEISILMALVPPVIIVIGIPNCIFLLNKFHFQNHKDSVHLTKKLIL